MKAKKLFATFTALCLAAAVGSSLCACGGPETDAEGNVIVTMTIINNQNQNPGWLAMIETANEILKEKGEKVRIAEETVPTESWDDYYMKVNSNILGEIGGTIGRIAESHIPLMVEKNQLRDLTSLKEKLVSEGAFPEEVFGGVAEKDGKYYGIPSGKQHMVLYYNKTLIDEYNAAHPGDAIPYPSGDWDHPSTFAEIRSAAKKLTSGEGASKKYGLSIGPFLAYAGMYAVNSGGDNIFNDKGECVIASDAFYNVYDWFIGMLREDGSVPNTAATSTLDANARFLGGNIAMLVDGIWQMHDICRYTGNYEIGIAAIPVLNDSYTAHTTNFSDQFWAARNSRTPKEDFIALEALMSAEAIRAAAELQVGGIPVRADCVDNYANSFANTKLKDYADVVIEGAKRTINVPYSTYYNIVDQQINNKLTIWMNGGMTTRDFVDFMDETMKKGMEGKL